MKKTFVAILALMFVFSSVGFVLAAPANPFGDVPAHHWSYDAVGQLVKAGIIDGFGDGGFQTDKIMTRYQMAQMVARAIWNKDKADQANAALITKLTREYANELDKLGVALDQPVSQTNTAQAVSKTADKITFSGDARIRYVSDGTSKTIGNKFAERLRINMNTNVNDNISLYGRFVGMNHTKMGTYKTSNDADRFNVADAAFTVKNFYGTELTLGRFSQQMDLYGYWMNTTGGVDGFKLTAGNELKVTAGFANFAPYAAMQYGTMVDDPSIDPTEIHNAYFVQGTYSTSKATKVGFWWLKERNGAANKFDVKSINILSKVSPKVTLAADYGENAIKTAGKEPAFYHFRVTYGTVSAAKPGSWNIGLDYRKFEPGVNNSIYTTSMVGSVSDAKGWAILGSTVLQKNVTLSGFYGFNASKVSNGAGIHDYSRMQVDILF